MHRTCPSVLPVSHPMPVRTITGQNFAKAQRTPREAARDAAEWTLGLANVKPTLKLAAATFAVSDGAGFLSSNHGG
jgi:hypothetical protein